MRFGLVAIKRQVHIFTGIENQRFSIYQTLVIRATKFRISSPEKFALIAGSIW
jgi:hypothetical protein